MSLANHHAPEPPATPPPIAGVANRNYQPGARKVVIPRFRSANPPEGGGEASPARGILIGLLIALPCWAGLAVLLWWLLR